MDLEHEVTPYIEEPPIWAQEKRAVLLMDVFSHYHGMYLAHQAKEAYGVATVAVLSDYMKGYFQSEQPENLEQMMTMCMPTPDQREDWCRPLEGCELVAISCESDSGLEDAERLGVLLNLRKHNGINHARRNKHLMIETVGSAGLKVVKQRLCHTVAEASEFAKELGIDSEKYVVVKPVRGVASDDVFLCRDMPSVESAFNRIQGSSIFGAPWEKHETVLVQEFAIGQEFAIDIVSKDGEHKAAAVWIYDKRPANGAPFVYHSTKLYDGDLAPVIFEYAKNCFDTLGIRWGLAHAEFILTEDGPRLVEVNCRQHNMDFAPLTMRCIGYNAFDMLLSAYLGGKDPSFYPPGTEDQRLDWDMLPEIPSTKTNGAMVHLVNFVEGTLTSVNERSLMEIQSMDSALDLEVYAPFLELGSEIAPTVDIRSDAGWVQIINPDGEAFERDYRRIIELMPTLFEVENNQQH